MSNLRLPQGSGAGGDAGGHNELEEVPNIYQLLNQHPPELWKIFVAINISYNVAETNNSKDKYKYKYLPFLLLFSPISDFVFNIFLLNSTEIRYPHMQIEIILVN